jgi:glutamyl-Q tRNA(Asp) synthetase
MTDSKITYRGRFAPSPTGSLHFGSLVAAVGSYLDAKANGGEWLVRIEDLDPPREVPGAANDILHTLEAFGFEWDGPVIYQSQRLEAYEDAVSDLLARGLAYPCGCSRKEIALAGETGIEGPIYPGTCRRGLPQGKKGRAIRLRTHSEAIVFEDRLQGMVTQSVEKEIGDFVIRRADGHFAYQLAVVVDDAWQGITHIVRGADLLLSTPRQLQLQALLGLDTPYYTHLPLVLDESGKKLSKQAKSLPVDPNNPLPSLIASLKFLSHPLPEFPLNLKDFWGWIDTHRSAHLFN